MSPVSAPRLEPETDTEITLGTGKMLILFFLLVALCAVFFGLGFSMGKNSVRSAPELLATPSGARPSAAEKTTTSQPPPTAQQSPAQAPADNSPSGGALPGNPGQSAQSPDQNSQQSATAQTPPAPGTGYFVQVAAVSKQEDADALVEALKGHQYSAFIATQPSDKLFHVQVGPYADIKDAEAIRAKLVADGYSPILKK